MNDQGKRGEIESEAELWDVVQAALLERDLQRPPELAWRSIQMKISALDTKHVATLSPMVMWTTGVFLTLLVLVGLWAIVQPGIVLQWSVSGQLPQTYRIYRAPSGSEDFVLIREIKAEKDISQYHYVDAFLLPGRSYSYRVEGVGQVGKLAVSQNVNIPPLQALPSQLAVIFTSLAAGYCAVMLIRLWREKAAEKRSLSIA